MFINLLGVAVGAAPLGLVLILGLGVAGWLYTKSPQASGALGLGIGAVGLAVVLGLAADSLLTLGPSFGVDVTGIGWLIWLAIRALHTLGIIGMLVAACIGPAPSGGAE